MKTRINVSLSDDTVERLKQHAWERHTTVSQAITDWIWATKVRHDQVRGQMSISSWHKSVGGSPTSDMDDGARALEEEAD